MTAARPAVEAADQCPPLRESGCELGQGYYVAKPLTADAATEPLADTPA